MKRRDFFPHMNEQISSAQKIRYLDGLRGIAALVVVVHHFILAFYPALFFGSSAQNHLQGGVEDWMSRSVFNVLYNGNFAVCLFFVLSGFVLSYKFFLEKKQEVIRESVVKRYFRLMIPVTFSVLIVFFLMRFSLFFHLSAAESTGSFWFERFWLFEENFFDALIAGMFGSFFSDTFLYNMVLWTISFEFLGSLLVFSFLAFFGTMKNRYIAYIALLTFFFQTYYLAFILGILLSDIATSHAITTKLRKIFEKRLIFWSLLSLGLFLGSFPSGRSTENTLYEFMHNSIFEDTQRFCHIIGAFFLILALLFYKKAHNVLSHRFVSFFGDISFSLYLLHFIILGSLTSFIFLQMHPYFSYHISALFAFGISTLFLILFSYWMYRHIDKKAIQFSKFLYLRFFK